VLHKRIRQAGAVAIAAATTAGLLGFATPPQASTTTGWRSAYSKHYGPPRSYSEYDAVTAFSATNAWAFGSSWLDRQGGLWIEGDTTTKIYILHRTATGTTWTQTAIPAPPASYKGEVDTIIPIPGDSGLWASGYEKTGSGGAIAKIWAYGKV
jgi:hypothetical protein